MTLLKLGREKKLKSGSDLYAFIALTLFSFLTLFFSSLNVLVDVKNVGLSMFSGFRGGIHEASSAVSRTVLAIRELASLRREYTELAERIARYEQLERSSAEIRQENIRLRELLGFSRDLRYQHIPAELIGRDPNNLFSVFIINKGKTAGIAVNMPVIAYHNGTQGLVGKVVTAGAFESLVMPLYDTACFVSSRLAESRYEGIVEGQGIPEIPLLMRYIKKRARDEINIGDMVISSGMGGIFPAGINIGRVNRINYRENELSMEVELEPSVDFSRLEHVFVIKTVEPAAEARQSRDSPPVPAND
ncbi:MAG: rod shape-determining protein MreC [Treponema sp.]|jgi:rod shape-determining protein MreC|nr:rod shape-determining protein MreC [Treponema sp.]